VFSIISCVVTTKIDVYSRSVDKIDDERRNAQQKNENHLQHDESTILLTVQYRLSITHRVDANYTVRLKMCL